MTRIRPQRTGSTLRFGRLRRATRAALESASRQILGLVAVACLLSAGCGDSGPDAVPVSGVVTLDGQPVPDVRIVFQPAQGSSDDPRLRLGASGTTDENGRFELRTGQHRGALPGVHVVTLIHRDVSLAYEEPDADSSPAAPESPPQFVLPPEARDRSLKCTVPTNGTESADFALVSISVSPEVPPEPETLTGGPDAAEGRAMGATGASSAGADRPTPLPGEAPPPDHRATTWYTATLSTWLVVLLGCFCWWRINVSRLSDPGHQDGDGTAAGHHHQ